VAVTEPVRDRTIVVTGVTGQVGGPVARALAADNEVVGAARFRDEAARRALEAAGVRCVAVDLEAGDVAGLPGDADYVVNFAVAKTNDWERDLAANSGGLAALMEHHRDATAFVHCSSTAVYRPMGHHVFREEDDLGDNHGVWPFLRTYSICKIAAEGTARWAARRFGLPTTIARLSVPYGDGGGWPAIHLEMLRNGSPVPVHVDAPSVYHPLHEEDIAGMLPALWGGAATDAVTVNWGGEDAVSIEEWCGYLGELTGLTPTFAPTAETIDSVQIDLTRMHAVAGTPTVPWRDGFRRMVEARHPELLAG
jgi:nucleoside-diphosphate-sugar epimerase